jgi:hypothetical protein
MNYKIDWTTLWILIAMFVGVLYFWDFTFMYPLKVFVVLLHEMSHGFAAVITGGSIDHIELSSNLGGVCWSSGGSRFVILSAGYLGSLLLGGLIMIAAARICWDRWITLSIGVIVVLITLIYVRTAFGVLFGFIFGIALILASKYLPEKVNDLLLKFIGLTSAMYAVIDIKEDLISRTVPGSDAYALSQEFFLPAIFWGVLWILIALAGVFFFVRALVRR